MSKAACGLGAGAGAGAADAAAAETAGTSCVALGALLTGWSKMSKAACGLGAGADAGAGAGAADVAETAGTSCVALGALLKGWSKISVLATWAPNDKRDEADRFFSSSCCCALSLAKADFHDIKDERQAFLKSFSYRAFSPGSSVREFTLLCCASDCIILILSP